MLGGQAWAGPSSLEARPEHHHITGGTEAQACDWPSVVALRDGGGNVFCTGSLVHPRVVLTAAHCLLSQVPADIAFGPDGRAPVADVGVQRCDWHPAYDGSEGSEGSDVAYCVLDGEVDLQVVPPAMGCEEDVLVPGTEVTIVGYGSTAASLDPESGWEWTEGVGPKRLTNQTLEQVYANTLFLLGIDGASACPGDSGGPALVRLSDGTWRTLGAGSRLHPDSTYENENDCGYGALYSTFAHVMPWIEDGAGYDITPCHDADGTWNPDERCGGFPLAPGDAGQSSGTWDDGCASASLSEYGQTCGAPFEEEPEPTGTTGTSTSGDDSGSDGALESSGEGESPSAGTGVTTGDEDEQGGTGSTPTQGDAQPPSVADDTSSESGCGCRQGAGSPSSPFRWLASIALFGLGLRRRRR